MNLHGKIMNINVIKENLERAMEQWRHSNSTSISDIIAAAYRYGHRDARHAAAELAVGIKFENCTKEGAEKGEGPPIIGEFKKGDQVKVWDYDGQLPVECVYFAFNEHPRAVYSHLVRHSDGNVFAYRYCSHSLPDLKMDDPVWIYDDIHNTWIGRHFAGWADTGHMKYWKDGGTSHSAKTENSYFITRKYRTSPPDK